MYISEIIDATNGVLLSGNINDYIDNFTQDSRRCNDKSMYIPTKGKKHDGHDYIDAAFSNGAKAIITEKRVNYPDKDVILVSDTLKALGDMARYKRIKSKAFVIGITGSVGKTSTKDMIYSVCKMKYKTLKTLGNYNNNVGLPLTILRQKDENVMVIEMGMNHLKEIDYLTNIAYPDIAVITNVGTAHIGELGSRENILKAKLEITNGLKKNGTLVINNDNDLLQNINVIQSIKKVGIDNKSDLQAYDIEYNSSNSMFKIDYNNKTYSVYVPVAGKHFVYNALIAIMVGLLIDIDIESCIKGVASFELTENRADYIKLKDNISVYDGTYNANLDSMKASIDVLSKNKSRKIAVLGDMLELGEYDEELHREIGKYLIEKNIDLTILTGDSVKYIIDELKKANLNYKYFNTNQEIISYLKDEIKKDDVILVKASHMLNFIEVVDFLKENFKA